MNAYRYTVLWCIVMLIALSTFLFSVQTVQYPTYGYSDVFYVRHPSECAFNGNGRSYNCAESNGSEGAFRGMSGIQWTTPKDHANSVRDVCVWVSIPL